MFLNAADSEHTSHTLTGNTQITATVDGGRGLTPFFFKTSFFKQRIICPGRLCRIPTMERQLYLLDSMFRNMNVQERQLRGDLPSSLVRQWHLL